MTVTFIGHSNTPDDIQKTLEKVLIELIEKHNAVQFYIGNHGNFDLIVKNTLYKLKDIYPHISFSVVLAYKPKTKINFTIFPKILENTHPKYAIIKRNQWMIEQSDTIITYVKNPNGRSVRFKEYAEKKCKKIINL